jgi:hypothetical protein
VLAGLEGSHGQVRVGCRWGAVETASISGSASMAWKSVDQPVAPWASASRRAVASRVLTTRRSSATSGRLRIARAWTSPITFAPTTPKRTLEGELI